VVEVAEEGDGGAHHDRGKNAGDEAEGEDGLLHREAPVGDLETLCGVAAVFVVMLSGDFWGWEGEIMLWGDSLKQLYCHRARFLEKTGAGVSLMGTTQRAEKPTSRDGARVPCRGLGDLLDAEL
jgi:hypothetical protein